MNTLYALTIVITSLNTGASFSETSKWRHQSEDRCMAVAEEVIKKLAFYSIRQGFDLTISYDCLPVGKDK